MIYLIGGPPRCGKTTLAKKMAKQCRISLVSTDHLGSISKAYTPESELARRYPYSHLRKHGNKRNNDHFYSTYSPAKIISALEKEAKAAHKAIDTFVACAIADCNDYIVEGYHVTPALTEKLQKKFGKKNTRAVFLLKKDAEQFAKNVHKSTTPNDWLLVLTKHEETFLKVGTMVSQWSIKTAKDAAKREQKVVFTDGPFVKQISVAMKYLLR